MLGSPVGRGLRITRSVSVDCDWFESFGDAGAVLVGWEGLAGGEFLGWVRAEFSANSVEASEIEFRP